MTNDKDLYKALMDAISVTRPKMSMDKDNTPVEKCDFKNKEETTAPAPKFVDAKNLGELLNKAAHQANEAKKDMTKPENWTPEMIIFYNRLVAKCSETAANGLHVLVLDITDLPKPMNFVLDYLRDHNNITYVRETYKGFGSNDGIRARLCW